MYSRLFFTTSIRLLYLVLAMHFHSTRPREKFPDHELEVLADAPFFLAV